MKNIKEIIFLLAAVTAASCSDPFDLKTKTADRTYLCVETVLTNIPSVQTINLSESIDYQSDSDAPKVSGATVTVSDGTSVVTFTEREDRPGSYSSPRGFACQSGKTYCLEIDCRLSDGTDRHYEASSSMEEVGFDIEAVDYKYLGSVMDSTWVLGVWGTDRPATNYFLITTAVNGVTSPLTSLVDRSMLMPDTYFNASRVNGFPIGYMYQTAAQMEKYGDCAKPLEEGDIVSLVVYSLTKDYYDFIMAMTSSATGISIPIISSQPANLPTNITGDDAMGYFAVCPVTMVSCKVEDPFRTEYAYNPPLN